MKRWVQAVRLIRMFAMIDRSYGIGWLASYLGATAEVLEGMRRADLRVSLRELDELEQEGCILCQRPQSEGT